MMREYAVARAALEQQRKPRLGLRQGGFGLAELSAGKLLAARASRDQ